MLSSVTCVLGDDAARMFYELDRFTRRGALPPNSLMLLQDLGSAAVLDGEAHHWRKRMLMSLIAQASIQALVDRFAEEWRGGWQAGSMRGGSSRTRSSRASCVTRCVAGLD